MAEPRRRPGFPSKVVMAVGVLLGAGAAALAMWVIGWPMVERAAGPITAWVFSALLVSGGALWGIRAGVRVARFFGPPDAGLPRPDTEAG